MHTPNVWLNIAPSFSVTRYQIASSLIAGLQYFFVPLIIVAE